ncbi:GFA family protein [uncultured Pseudosulfitobacter sp.]|uniref:GFA family protein n=1 Tax=uncultured Pseudosulfitobacter sp. TaxID=2854214 RepID=UPI0030DD90C7|tara:strand:+ start:207 stop:623 length:417 start_codon:yes stop_codon:yes gene_type:complete
MTHHTGGCYCGAVRYETSGDAMFKAQCHCRECQYLTGGGPNFFMLMTGEGFSYTQGAPKQFKRADLDDPVTREFCADCGTHLVTLNPRRGGHVIVKVGTLDDPSGAYGGPAAAIYTCDQQPFHTVAEGLPCFEKLPPR